MSATPSISASRRVRQVFKLIKQLSDGELDVIADLIAKDRSLVDLILEKNEPFQKLGEAFKNHSRKLDELLGTITSLGPRIIEITTAVTKLGEEREKYARVALAMLAKLKKRNAPPRNTERDDEIVRLRDDEEKSFGEIPRLLQLRNAHWCGKGGKPITRDAAEQAYGRRKNSTK